MLCASLFGHLRISVERGKHHLADAWTVVIGIDRPMHIILHAALGPKGIEAAIALVYFVAKQAHRLRLTVIWIFQPESFRRRYGEVEDAVASARLDIDILTIRGMDSPRLGIALLARTEVVQVHLDAGELTNSARRPSQCTESR